MALQMAVVVVLMMMAVSHSGGIDDESRIIKVIGVNIYDRMK